MITVAAESHPAVYPVRLTGSRARGDARPLSDWDFQIETNDFPALATALPSLVEPLEPLAQQLDRLSQHACYMLMLRGVGKVDLIFDKPRETSPSWVVSAGTLSGIDEHFWDWTIWLASKDGAGKPDLVRMELEKLHEHLLGPLRVERIPESVQATVRIYRGAREEAENRLHTEVSRELDDEVVGLPGRADLSSKSRIGAVFFDLDDTLCDTIGTREARARRASECLCRMEPGFDQESLVRRALEPLAEPRSALGVRGMLQELGLLDQPAGIAAMEAVREYYEPLCLFAGVRETLEELAEDYPLGVITNWDSEDEQRRKLQHLGLESSFRYLVVSAAAGWEKPDVRIFQHASSLAGVEPAEAVFVGDRLDVDIGGAKAAGMRAVWFNHWGGQLDGAPSVPEAVIESFAELPEVLIEVAGT